MGSGYKGPYSGTIGSDTNNKQRKELIENLLTDLVAIISKKVIEEFKNHSSLLQQMPNYDKSITPIEKFIKYSLDPTNPNNHGKAEAYKRGLGFDKSNAETLRNLIHQEIISGKYKPYDIEKGKGGIKYKYKIPVTGPNGKTKNVIVVYQIDYGKNNPRMITNYLDKERNQND